MDDDGRASLPSLESDLEIEGGSLDQGLEAAIREFLVVFVKTVRTAMLYVQGNPLLHQFLSDLGRRLDDLFDREPSISFTVHESELRWQGQPVYKEKLGTQDNLAFPLYRDGIRRIEFHPGVEEDEIRRFIDILRLAKTLRDEEDDLLTLMWNADFKHLRYEYVDVLGDEPPVPTPELSHEAGTQLPALPELELAPELQTPTLREDFEPSLYFLGEADVAHLQQELRREWDRPVRRDVMVSVLDQYEIGEVERRVEVVDILRQMLPRVLAEGGFKQAAYIVGELKTIAERKKNTQVEGEVEEIIAELSQPIVLEQLVRILEDGTIDPNSEALATLLSALRPEAIVVLIQMIPGIARKEVRDQLLATLDTLARKNPKVMEGLVSSEDPRVAAESARIAGRLKMTGMAEAVSALLTRTDGQVRLAAVEALVSLRTSMAGAPLLKALEDDSREVRVAAAKGLAELKYSPGAKQLEGHLTGGELARRDLTEQLAFFEAYARAAGDDATHLLARLLNGRRFLWLKHPSQVRACAARALSLIGSPGANQALTQAERDSDPMVLSALHQARRGRRGGPA